MNRARFYVCLTSVLVCSVPSALQGAPLGTAVSYQGRLVDGGVTVCATCDFEFSLFEDAGGLMQVGATQTIVGVPVTDGLFTVELNGLDEFGPTAFIGDERYLEIAVKCPPDAGFTSLSPLQPILATPYAQALPGLRTALSGDGSVPDSWNVIGGHKDNTVAAGVGGATISGGGSSFFTIH